MADRHDELVRERPHRLLALLADDHRTELAGNGRGCPGVVDGAASGAVPVSVLGDGQIVVWIPRGN